MRTTIVVYQIWKHYEGRRPLLEAVPKGRSVFFGWLDAVSEQKSKLKEHFPSGGWKNTTPKEVFNIGASLADKPKVAKMRLGGFKKKKSQRQKRAEC